MRFFLPMQPPRVTAQTQGYRRYKSPEIKAAEQKFTAALAPHRPAVPATGATRLVAKWIWYTPNKKLWGTYKTTKPDTDNMQKLFKDAMQKCGYFRNDAVVASEIVEKFWGEVPGIFVEVVSLDG